MDKWLRRIRGAIGMGLTWAFAWFAAGMVLLFIVGFGAADVPFPLGFGLLGFLAGVTFSGVLGLVEGRRSFHEMSLPRFALWGGLGGLLFSAVFVGITDVPANGLLLLGPIFAAAGAGCAAGSLALARMATDPALPYTDEEIDEIGLTEEESRELLGGGG
ncbi:MAG: hypothetical protein R3253_11450 [Longimicrobiales bacterium]|nr:hypothetical protein [Longimicrobiales bacterium]